MMRRFLVLALTLAAGANAAWGEQNKQSLLGMSDPNAPIEVSADNFLADANSRSGTYSGNVVVRQGEVRMRANTVRVNMVAGKPEKIFAQGNVVFDAPSGTATGDSGVYDIAPRLVTLTGRVVLTKDKNVMRGSLLTINLITGIAKLGDQQQGGRIQGLFTPESQPNVKN